MKISEIFNVEYPKTLVYSQMTSCKTGINFVSSQEKNNGVVDKVERIEKLKIYPAGVITVPLKGSVLMASVQAEPCYVAHQIAVLSAKLYMTLQEKMFYSLCIRQNAFRFSFGRQADNTLKDIELPDTIPAWVDKTPIKPFTTLNKQINIVSCNTNEWQEFELGDLFDFHKGKRLTKADMIDGVTNYLGAINDNNGVRQRIDVSPIFEPNCITVNYNGSVGEAFYQSEPFWATDDVNVLYAKNWTMNKHIALFITTIIKANRFKFSYGHKWTLEKMKKSVIKLPVTKCSTPDWGYMENYIKSLPYSDRI